MTPKEKAKELVDKFQKYAVIVLYSFTDGTTSQGDDSAKQCALIAIDETIEHLRVVGNSLKVKWEIIFLNSVKEEINKL